MVSKAKLSLLIAAASLAAAGQAQAAATFNLDLRFAPTTNNQYASNISSNGKVADVSGGGGIYQVQVWGQITDSTQAFATDALNALSFDLQSGHSGTQLLTGGGVTNFTPFTTGTGATGTVGVVAAASNTTADGVADWGAAATSPSTIISSWSQWGNSSGYALGQTVTDANGNKISGAASVANTWEALLGTFTIDASQLNPAGGNQTFNLGMMDKYAKTPSGTNNANTVTLDSVATGSLSSISAFSVEGTQLSAGVTVGSNGVTFQVVPEPASLGVLMLGGLALLARRRRA